MSEFIPNPARGKEVYDLDRAHVFHSWSAQSQISPLPVATGAGSYFWDFDGKKYLDFSCQLVFTNIGFQHPVVVEAIKKQADLLTTVAPQVANDARGEAARRIVELASPHHQKVFFTNGG
ncbi:MAG: aminotransferase class III-fold pyridoxal phosphate-dependent enzyme, partial [Actinomycetota bacterium]